MVEARLNGFRATVAATAVVLLSACGSSSGTHSARPADSEPKPIGTGFNARLAQMASSPAMAKTVLGVDAKNAGVDASRCHDSFDGGEPRAWVQFSLGRQASAGAEVLRKAALHNGWRQVGTSTSEGLTETTFSQDFGGWIGQLVVSVGPGSELSSLMGVDTEARARIASETYCSSG